MPKYLIHTLLISFYPVIWLYSNNLHQAQMSDMLIPVLVILTLSFLMILLIFAINKNIKLSSLIVSLSLLFIFSFGPLQRGLKEIPVTSGILSDWYLSVLILLGLVILIRHIVVNLKDLKFYIRFITILSIVLIVMPLLIIIQYKFSKTKIYSENKIKPGELSPKINNTQKLPDIYFIILDRYASANILADEYKFDNSNFLKFLKDKGFMVLENSWANYHTTAHSLASTLNMKYLNDSLIINNEEDPDWKPIYSLIKEHNIGKYLKKSGYKYIHFGSWWWPTTKIDFADRNINLGLLSEFSGKLISNTIFEPLLIKFNFPLIDSRYAQWRRVNYQFEKLNEGTESTSQKFIFVHFIIPHDPFIFESNGSFLKAKDEKLRDSRRKYIDQVIFLNSKLKLFVENVIKNNQNSIIILQADEGPYPDAYEVNKKSFDWSKADKSDINMKLSILNVIYLPDRNYSEFSLNSSPVNTFRIILNKYLGYQFEILNDRHFMGNMKFPYKLVEIKK